MTADLRSRIVQCNTQPVSHDNPELGKVFLRRMTLGELNSLQQENETSKTDKTMLPLSVRLLARFIGDETGKPEFDLKNKADTDALLGLPVAVVADILRAGNRLNNLTEVEPGKA